MREILIRAAVCLCLALAGCTQPLSPKGQLAYELSLATDNARMVVAWHGGEKGNDIWIRQVDANGKPAAAPVRLVSSARDAYEPDIHWLGDDLVVAWYEKDSVTGAMTARVGKFTLQGTPIWQLALSSPGSKGRSVVAQVHRDQLQVAWIQTVEGAQPALWTARIDALGAYLQNPQSRVVVSPDTWNLNAAVDQNGDLRVVYDARTGTRAKELHLLTVAADRVVDQLLSSDDGHDSVYPDLALSGDRAALTWFDSRDGNAEVYLLVSPLSALASPVDGPATRVTRTPGESIGAYLAWNADRLGLAWSDDVDGQSEVFSETFDASGRSLEPAQRLTNNPTQSSIPAIRPWKQGFALAWNEYRISSGNAGHPAVAASTAVLLLRP